MDSDFPACANVPPSLRGAYAKVGVRSLFPWQSDCLSIEKLFAPDFGNFVYTAPTSAGKPKRALFVFPFISSAREKYIQLQTLWRSTDLVVKAFIGASSASMHGWSAAVCTIEKANALVNAFIETDTLDEIYKTALDQTCATNPGQSPPSTGNISTSRKGGLLVDSKHNY
uniref:Uncharacterized protein n=1 Tax=Ditylenchus dipsaci TaxID=166011 RepID=A0A915DK73_9BILA